MHGLARSGRREPGKATPVYETNATRSETRLDLDARGAQVSEVAGMSTGSRSSSSIDGRQSQNQTQRNGHVVELGRTGNRQSGEKSVGLSRQPSAVLLEPVTVRGRPLATGERIMGATVSTPPLRKLLFSATLTNNPQKLAGLGVVNPLIYTARETMTTLAKAGSGGTRGEHECGGGTATKRPSQETRRSNLDEIAEGGASGGRFSTPATLDETYTVCDSQVMTSNLSEGNGVGNGLRKVSVRSTQYMMNIYFEVYQHASIVGDVVIVLSHHSVLITCGRPLVFSPAEET